MFILRANVNSTVIPRKQESRKRNAGKYFYIIPAQLDSRLRGNDAQILNMSHVLFNGNSLSNTHLILETKKAGAFFMLRPFLGLRITPFNSTALA